MLIAYYTSMIITNWIKKNLGEKSNNKGLLTPD